MDRKQEPNGDSGNKGLQGWFSENRDPILKEVVADLLVVALITIVGIALGASDLLIPLWVFAIVLPVTLLGGAYLSTRRRSQERVEPPPPYLVKAAAEAERLRAYFEQLRVILEGGLGEGLGDVEQELLVKPARMFEEMTGVNVQLAVFEPFEPDTGPPRWQIRYRAGISQSECREFEVPLKDSYIAWMQRRWEADEVFGLDDLPGQVGKTVAAGSEVEAFERAGFKMLKCVRSGAPSAGDEISSCLVLLSREALPNGTEDAYLMLLGRLLYIHFQLTGMDERVKAVERLLSEQER